MKVAMVYTSMTGNTEALMRMIEQIFQMKELPIEVYPINVFGLEQLEQWDAIVIGSYSWGNGNIPYEMRALFTAFEQQDAGSIVTAVFGTGDSFYPYFCGAVDQFRDMLYVHTDLAVTLKVELLPQPQDVQRCETFVERFIVRLRDHLEINI